MRILSRAFGLCLLVAAAPLAGGAAEAAPAPAPSAAPYHPIGGSGHGLLQTAGWSARDDRRDDHWSRPRAPRSWGAPPFGHGPAYGAPGLLPRWVVEHRLRHQSFRPVGRIVLRHGVYLVPALDPRGRRVVLAVDPATAVILGRLRRH